MTGAAAGPIPDKSIERLPEYIRKYSDEKAAVTRFAATLALLSLVVAFAARTPSIRIAGDPNGIVKTDLQARYLLVYGEPLILIVAMVYWSRAMSVYAMLAAIAESTELGHLTLLPVEKAILHHLFERPRDGNAWLLAWCHQATSFLRRLNLALVPIVAFFCYVSLLGPYFELWRGHGLLDVLVGIGAGWDGFKPAEDVPYVYVWNTWVNSIGALLMFAFLAWAVWKSFHQPSSQVRVIASTDHQ